MYLAGADLESWMESSAKGHVSHYRSQSLPFFSTAAKSSSCPTSAKNALMNGQPEMSSDGRLGLNMSSRPCDGEGLNLHDLITLLQQPEQDRAGVELIRSVRNVPHWSRRDRGYLTPPEYLVAGSVWWAPLSSSVEGYVREADLALGSSHIDDVWYW